MSADRNLQKEIAYLSKLIKAHKQPSRVHKPQPYTRSHRSTHNYSSHQSKQHSTSNRRVKVYHGNRVYKPADSGPQQPSTMKSPRVASTRENLKTKNLVYQPHQSTVLSTTESAKSTGSCTSNLSPSRREVKESKTTRPSASKFKWKRKSLSDNQTNVPSSKQKSEGKVITATLKRAGSHKNTKYKWRRRSSSGSKDKSVRTPISPLIAQSKFKLTRASLLRSSPDSPFSHRAGTFRQRRLSYRKKHTPLSQRFKSMHSSSRVKSLRKSKNKVWIASKQGQGSQAAKGSTDSVAGTSSSSHSSVFVGHEVTTARGNKQWVATSLAGQARSRSRSGVISLRGDKFVQDRSGKKLKRLSSSSRLAQALRKSVSGVVKSSSVKQYLASQAVRKSRQYVWNAKHKDKSKQYCMFFNRFGKCNHRDTCPYIHDPDKIAVCTKFLRGVCEKTDGSCPFSHKISKEKMPVCSFFLRGVCSKDQCPYLHVSVGRDAEVCMDFVRGYCPRGEECTMQHVLDCQEFLEKGACPRGKSCPLRHRERLYKVRREKAQQSKATLPISVVKEPYAFKIAARHRNKVTKNDSLDESEYVPSVESTSTPFDISSAPDFIAL